jgi:hypothetical protein
MLTRAEGVEEAEVEVPPAEEKEEVEALYEADR